MNRRNPNAVSGYVNFPTHEESTGEGGMFVQLIVVPKDDWDNSFMQCCGGDVTIPCGESLVYADFPEYAKLENELIALQNRTFTDEEYETGEFIKCVDREIEIREEQVSLFFPWVNNPSSDGWIEENRYSSIALLAAFTLGSTGWSGSFLCTYEDLTVEGKLLYDQLKALYAGTGDLVLLTWLDT